MASIPLPALHVEAPQQPDTLGNFAKLLAIKNQVAMAPLQQQEARQQVQSGAVDLQQKQLQMKAQQTLQAIGPNHITRDDKGRPTGYDYDGLMNDATSKGIPPAMLAPIQEMHKKAVDTVLAQTNADKGRIENQLSINKQAYEQMEGIKSLTDPAQRQQAWQEFGQWAQKNGMDTSQAPPQAPDNDTLTAREAVLGMHGQALADAKELAQANEAKSRAHEADVNAQKTEQEMKLGTGPMAESKYRNILMNEKLGRPVSAEDQAWKSAYEKSKTLVPVASFNLQNAGATGQGDQPSAIAQAIASGQMKWGDAVSARTPMAVKQAILKEVKSINPNFNSGDFSVEQKQRENFTSGAYSQQLNSINTAREHMKTFNQMADALDNGDVQTLNKFKQFVGTEFGSDKATNFGIVKQAFSSEVGKAFAGASVAEADRSEIAKQISSASSPTQLRGVAKVADELLAGKQRALKQTYQQGQSGKPNFGDQSQSNNGAQPDSSDPFAAFGGKKH